MAGLDWDRLRRIRPLDGVDHRVDPDGAHLWEQPREEGYVPFGARRLRRGVIVRRKDGAPATGEPARPRTVRCPRCDERVEARTTVRHATSCPRA